MTPLKSELTAYDVEEEIGRGDLTIIYRARRKDDGLPVAIKVVVPQFTSDDYFIRRFVEAGERATRLAHPNIARVYEAGRRQDVVYVVRDLVQAESLADRLARTGAMSPVEVIPILRQLASALDYAHDRRLMHGDLNDRCVFVSDDGHVTLTDLGLTQSLAGTDLVKTGYGVAALEYLASERAQGQGPSRSADIYALGVLAYQMLVGRVPFAGEPAAVLRAQVYDAPPVLHVVNPKVPAALSEAVARALAKQPELRYNTAAEFVRAFAAAAEGIAPATERPLSLRLWQRPLFWAVVIAPVAGLFLAVVLWNLASWGERQAARLAVPPTATLTPGPQPTASLAATILPLTPTLVMTPTPSPSPTITLASTPAPLTVAEGSPFSNLVLARGISDDHKPVAPGNDFTASAHPVYLFFDYRGIKPGTRWGHVWVWGDRQLDRSITTWPEEWGTAGTAWVFYTPDGGFQPGPYEVRLLVNDQVVASASFIMR